ncbi:carboxymuconolactone decarboxylase family protein [Pyxidicoccus sp. MSG2]|uniref:carboxymuconolactone decarboxylase family protein n=1 Tax=Pyxidicoccus sp. MSG2 TaxID=2996790 RepID=UPI00226DCCFB|nr:carboxymuconolactone decarboxylase family protein [Pyxidicoccus sp. MSG2]MCY1016988.1 carboxymuconolactone decarboxylase family protein [Pyxidicoccus sp. MSG2]
MQARMKNPAMLHPEALQALMALAKALKQGGVPAHTLELVHLRASQINGCAFCVDLGVREARKAGETDERLFAVATWRESPHFNDAERAALAFAESATRLSDRPDPVPDDVWKEAARYYEEPALAQLVMYVAMTNMWNRLNVPTRQVAGSGW